MKLRLLIKEIVGIHVNSLLLSNIASKELLGYIDRNKEKMNDGETFGIDYPLELNIDEQTKKDTNISKIYIDLYFRNTAIAKSNAERKENITGKFIVSEIDEKH